MITAEPYPTPTPSPLSGIPEQVTGYLTGLIPPGIIGSGIAVVLTGLTVILVAVGHRHARQQNWCSGWVSGPLGIVIALFAASYAATGLPALAGVSPGDVDPRTILVEAAVALAVATLVTGAVWPVAVHVALYRGRPISLPVLRDWAQTQRLHAGGGAAAGAAAAWIVLDPLLCVAGAVLGLLITGLVEHLRGHAAVPVTPAPRREQQAMPAPVLPPISDEW